MPDRLQQFTEGSVEEALAMESAGGDSAQDAEPEVFLSCKCQCRPNEPTSFVHALSQRYQLFFSRIPKLCVPYVRYHVRCAEMVSHLQPIVGDAIASDQKRLSEDNASMLQHGIRRGGAVFTCRIQRCPTRNESADDTRNSLQQFLPPSKQPGRTSKILLTRTGKPKELFEGSEKVQHQTWCNPASSEVWWSTAKGCE